MPLETIPPIPPELQDLAAWLMDAGQIEAPVEEIVQGCCRRLVAAGIPVCRINIGGLLLHPVHIVRTVIWDGDTGEVRSEALPREVLLAADAMESPFNWLESKAIPFLRCRLDVEDGGPSFPIFDRFRSQGMTDYFAFFRSNGRPRRLAWSDLPPGTDGIVGAWTTRQAGGFTDAQIAGLKAISRPLALTIKAVSADDLTATLLDTYLGRYTGQHVLQGRIGRGDGELVEAALWYSDLRDSTRLADTLPLRDYLNRLNAYFECSAGAVIEQGGEVLKFIGDAVLAIFPVRPDHGGRAAACTAALDAARDALRRIRQHNDGRASEADGSALQAGISLHVGEVMYGNVGTERRLDFTATGPAVNELVRLESLCKVLGRPVAVSAAFRAAIAAQLVDLGTHPIAGKPEGLRVFTLPDPEQADRGQETTGPVPGKAPPPAGSGRSAD